MRGCVGYIVCGRARGFSAPRQAVLDPGPRANAVGHSTSKTEPRPSLINFARFAPPNGCACTRKNEDGRHGKESARPLG